MAEEDKERVSLTEGFERPEIRAQLVQALDHFALGLSEAARLETESADEAARAEEENDLAAVRRARAHAALYAVLRYFTDIGLEQKLRVPLRHLLAGLEDVSQGRRNPMFEPASSTVRESRKLNVDVLQDGLAAASVTILREKAHLRLDEAVAKVARKLGYEHEALLNLRKALRKDPRSRSDARRHSSNEAREAYSRWMKVYKDSPRKDDPVGFVDDLLKYATEQAGKRGN